jgi:hypothetical protein
MTTQYFKFLSDHREPNVVTADTMDKWNIDNPYSYRTWYNEDIRNSSRLLITIGDSWTWGDHLGGIDWNGCIDDPVRLTQIFGRLLSNKLNSDWVNIANPGCSNYWMLEKLELIEPHLIAVKDRYKKIDIVVTLTEDLRESTYTEKIPVDRIYNHFWNKSNNIKEFLIEVESFLFSNLQNIADRLPFVNLYVSRAFTDTWLQNKCKFLLEKTWCDVIQDNFKFENYQPVPFIGQLSIDPLTQKFIKDDIERKTEFLDIMDAVTARWNFLGESLYNLKGSTCHPNPMGHSLWSEYLFTQIA